MKKIIALMVLTLGMLATTAQAGRHEDVRFSISFGSRECYPHRYYCPPPRPVVVYQPVVTYCPPPVYVAPPPPVVIVNPSPAYVYPQYSPCYTTQTTVTYYYGR